MSLGIRGDAFGSRVIAPSLVENDLVDKPFISPSLNCFSTKVSKLVLRIDHSKVWTKLLKPHLDLERKLSLGQLQQPAKLADALGLAYLSDFVLVLRISRS